jgi:putative DNA primase/helicase
VERRLGFAEGIETSLSVMTAFNRTGSWYRPPVWAALDAGNMGDLPVVDGIDTVLVYADRGRVGEQAADTLAQRWTYAERDVFVALAPVDDWNPAVAS